MAEPRSRAAGDCEAAGPAEPAGAWDDHAAARRRKFTRGLAATPAQRLAWLEGALELAAATGALERARRARRRETTW